MDVHEGAEILARLGILESTEESPQRKKDEAFVDISFNDVSDDDSGGEVIFDRNALMSGTRRRGGGRSRIACCIFAESSIFALFIINAAVFVAGFTLYSSPNVFNLIDSPTFPLHYLVQIIGLLCGVLIGRRLVGTISFTSLISISLCTIISCSAGLIFSTNIPAIVILFIQSAGCTMIKYCGVSLVVAFWRGHRRKIVLLFVLFTLGSLFAPSPIYDVDIKVNSVVKRQSDNGTINMHVNGSDVSSTKPGLIAKPVNPTINDGWDWSGDNILRGSFNGGHWISLILSSFILSLFILIYILSCRFGVYIDARVQRLREVEEFTPLSIGFRIRVVALQITLAAVLSLCEYNGVISLESKSNTLFNIISFSMLLSFGDIVLSLNILISLVCTITTMSISSYLSIFPFISHSILSMSSSLSLVFLPLVIDIRLSPRPFLSIDLLLLYPLLSRIIVPLSILFSISPSTLIPFFSILSLLLLFPLIQSIQKAERVLLTVDAHNLDPTVLPHRPLTNDDYSALINAIDEESEDESLV